MSYETVTNVVLKTPPIVYVQQTCWWVKKNPQYFKRIMHLLHEEVDAGNPCVQRGDVFNLARKA